MVLDPSLDLGPIVGAEGFDDLPDYIDIAPTVTTQAPPADTGSEIAPSPQKQMDDWADISLKVYRSLHDEVPAVPTSSSFFERFEGLTDIVGKPIDKLMDVLSLPADTTERVAGLLYWNDVDLATRWQLGQLTYESIGTGDKSEIMKRIQAGEDVSKVVDEYEGGWADMLTKLALDPLNAFGVPFLGLAAKALPEGSTAAKALRAANRGVSLRGRKIVETAQVEKALGGVDPGYVRLYRAEPVGAVGPGQFDDALKGSWFSDDIELPELMIRRNEARDGAHQIYYVDVPQEVAERLRAPRSVASNDYQREYNLSDKFIAAKKPVENIEAERALLAQRQNPQMLDLKRQVQEAKERYNAARGAFDGLPYGWADETGHGSTPEFEAIRREYQESRHAFDDLTNQMAELPLAQRFLSGSETVTSVRYSSSLMRRLGIGVTEEQRVTERLQTAVDAWRRHTMTGDEVREASGKWFAKPTNWIKGLVQQTTQSKRNEMGYSFMLNVDQMARSENDWASIRNYVGEIFDGTVNGTLTARHPGFALATEGARFDQPASLMGIQAVGDWAAKTGATVDDLPSMHKPWFTGKPEEWELLDDAAKKAMFPNKEQWLAAFLDDMHEVVGTGEKPGAFDLYAGLAALGEKGVKYEDPTGMGLAAREADRIHGIVKNGMSIFWLNTPRYAVANAISNTIRGITAIGTGQYRYDKILESRFGKEAIKFAAADPARLHELHLTETAATRSKSLRDWVIRPFVKMGAENRWFGDNSVRQKVALLTAKRFMQQHYIQESESSFGILKAIDWGADVDDVTKAALATRLRESWDNPRAFLDELRNGSIGLSPAHALYDKALEAMGVQGNARWMWRDLLGEDAVRQIEDAYKASSTPQEFVRNLDRIAGKQVEFTAQFAPLETLTQPRGTATALFDMRVREEETILRFETERMALMSRVAESRGQNGKFLKDTMDAHIREQQKRLKALYEKLDFDLPHDLEGAKAARAKEVAAYDKWEDSAWRALTKKLQSHYGKTDPELAKFFEGVNVDRLGTARDGRKFRNAEWKKVDGLDNGRHDPRAGQYFEVIAANRAKAWDDHFNRIAAPWGISRLQSAPGNPNDYVGSLAEGWVRLREDTTRIFSEMKKHAGELYTEGGLKRGVALTPEQSRHILSQLDTLEEDAALARSFALRAGRMMADHALLNYDRKYGADDILKYMLPYHFWPSRMAHRYMRAGLTRPGAAGAFGVLVKGQYEITEDMPERFKGKVGIPVPFMPDWMGGGVYFDPIKMLFPFSQGIEPNLDNEESLVGRVDAWMSSVGAGAAPWITMPLQMTGAMGERDQWIRYQMQGLPFGLPGTPAQQAITHFLMGDTPDTYDGELTPEDIRTLTLGDAFPEPRLREILGIPPGDQWDFYRVLRMLANMAGDGTITAEQGLRAMKERSGAAWDEAKSRASTEAGLRNLSSWAAGLNLTIYPKGEEIQNGLEMIFRAARDADRKGGSDGNLSTFFDSFPEYQVRQVQKSWYRGQPEMDSELDTNLYYIDLNQVQEQYDPEIDYYQKLKEATPKGQRKEVSNRLEYLYEAKNKAIKNIKLRYAKRKLTPSMYANPYDRALALLREQFYNIEADSIEARLGGQSLFVSKLAGSGMGESYYDFGKQADAIIEEYDAKIAAASNTEKDDLYRLRSQAIESLTSKAMMNISPQDFMAYIDKRKREPSEDEAKRQQASDALRTFFHAPPEARSAVLAKYPMLQTVYGANPTESLAGALDQWWANYDRLQPNSVARDDYVQSTAPKLNAIRAALGMAPLQPRERPVAPPFIEGYDPYTLSIAESGTPEDELQAQ